MALPQLEKIAAAQGFKGEAGQIIAASMVGEDRESVRRVIVVGLGAEDELCLEGVRKALGSGLKEAEKLKVEVLTAAPPGVETAARCRCGSGHGGNGKDQRLSFRSLSFREKEAGLKVLQLGYTQEQEADVLRGLKVGQALGRATNLARDLVNEPANAMTPGQLAAEAKKSRGGAWF